MLTASSTVPSAGRPTSVRWRVCVLIGVASFVAYILRTNMSVAGAPLSEDLGLSQFQLGIILAAFAWAYALFQFPGGVFGDVLGARRAVTILAVAWGRGQPHHRCGARARGGLDHDAAVGAGRRPRSDGDRPGALLPDNRRCRYLQLVPGVRLGPAGLASERGAHVRLGGSGAADRLAYRALWMAPVVRAHGAAGLSDGGGLVVVRPRLSRPASPGEPGRAGADRRGTASGRHGRAGARCMEGGAPTSPAAGAHGGYTCSNYVFYFFFNWLFIYLIESRGFRLLEGGFAAAAPWIAGGCCAVLVGGPATGCGNGWARASAVGCPVRWP